eukprot:TRINITY_DN5812_c2_g1_i2.p1 TRINITY_DN5812_c2_g1~~TRINITY_DN5812_c2_g1_i2.p1  ORF type:complete len:285 (+),score=38.36 TRINITY_DN5812_c2_g1_i2:80-856(+)
MTSTRFAFFGVTFLLLGTLTADGQTSEMSTATTTKGFNLNVNKTKNFTATTTTVTAKPGTTIKSTGSVEMSVAAADVDAFLSNAKAATAIRKGIADTIGIPEAMVTTAVQKKFTTTKTTTTAAAATTTTTTTFTVTSTTGVGGASVRRLSTVAITADFTMEVPATATATIRAAAANIANSISASNLAKVQNNIATALVAGGVKTTVVVLGASAALVSDETTTTYVFKTYGESSAPVKSGLSLILTAAVLFLGSPLLRY